MRGKAMPRVKRPVFLFFYCQDHGFVDIGSLLRGELVPTRVRQLYALPAARGEAVPVDEQELGLILSVPSDRWVEPKQEVAALLAPLAAAGLVLVEDGEGELSELRRRDELLAASGWNAYGALFHFLTRWSGVDLRRREPGGVPTGELPTMTREVVERFVAERGPPPPAFHSVEAPRAVQELPLVERDDGLFALLTRRRTTRAFDRERPLKLEELAIVLRYVFGVHGYAPVLGDVVTLKRTSPSGGGLHPVEAYPLVADVDGVQPGIYHYRARDHSLELLETFASAEEARATAVEFVCGQTYFGSAHVFFALTARFARNHWKYRSHHKAYPALLMDAAHLSQTLYLVATELRLGAFVTAAVNGADVERRLGLDGFAEGVLAVAGCGRPAAALSPFDPEFLPFVPRKTTIP
jgi:putative peptide maturation dehydrogenase